MTHQINRPAKKRQEIRAKLYVKQHGKCHWCQGRMSLQVAKPPRPDYATFEHIRPVSLGGSDRQENLVLACSTCNRIRGNRDGHNTAFGYASHIADEFDRVFRKTIKTRDRLSKLDFQDPS